MIPCEGRGRVEQREHGISVGGLKRIGGLEALQQASQGGGAGHGGVRIHCGA